jgi:hypothetical protein
LASATPTLMLRYLLSFSCSLALFALPAAEAPIDGTRVAELYERALVAENFKGAQIEGILLGEPESANGDFEYSSEFTVRQNGRAKHCEDWRFKLKKAERAWYVTDIRRGRCSG